MTKKDQLIGLADLTPQSCRWPFNNLEDPDFHFCGKPSIPERPYCLKHCQMAYLKSGNTQNENEPENQEKSSS